jgi:predicted PurR-regulated permease PerM
MDNKKSSGYFLLICLAAAFVLLYYIFQPFLAALVLAAVFASLFQPLYRRLSTRLVGWPGLSAFLVALAAIAIVLLPISLLVVTMFWQAFDLYQALAAGGSGWAIDIADRAVAQASFLLPAGFELDVAKYAQQALGVLVGNLGALFTGLAKILLSTFVFLMALYFFLKDGERLKNYLIELSPLADSDDELIVGRLKTAVAATAKGSLLIGLTQGFLTGVGFAIFGVPNAVLWGGAAAIMALVPGIGTAIVIAPAVAFLLLTGSTLAGLGLLAWGMVAVGLVDNILGPKLVGEGMKLHPLAVLLSVLGGLALFGPLGFLLGPLSMSLALALTDIYSSLRRKEAH